MALVTVTTRVDEELYAQAKEASKTLGRTLQDAFGQCLESFVESAKDPARQRGREAARRGVIAEEIMRIKGMSFQPVRRKEVLEEIIEIQEKVR